jgi:hypothetical protein
MTRETKKASARFALAMPPDVDKAVREYAKGDTRRPAASVNETIVFLIRKGLEAAKKESTPGQPEPLAWAA